MPIPGKNKSDSPSTVVRRQVRPVDDRIPKRLVGVVDAQLCTKTPAGALRGPLGHLLEVLEVVLDSVVAMLGRNAVHALLAHLLLLGVVRVRFTSLDHLQGILIQLIEVVRRMRNFVAVDVEKCEVLEDGLLEFGLQRKLQKGF